VDARQLSRGVQPVGERTLAGALEVAAFDPSQSAGLFVGVRSFDYGAFAEVPYAVDDAVDLAHLFSLELHLISPEKVVLAVSGEPQKRESRKRLQALLGHGAVRKGPSRSEIIHRLQRLATSSDRAGLAVVTVATHGFLDDGEILLTSDAVTGRVKTTGLPAALLFDEVARAGAPRRVVLLDACQERLIEGARAGGTQTPQLSEKLARKIAETRGLVALMGTTAGGFSYDDKRSQNGVFSKAVLEGLCGKAAPQNGFITVKALADYVDARVVSWVREERPDHVGISRGITRQIEGSAGELPLAEAR
jgi:hypothetical protein